MLAGRTRVRPVMRPRMRSRVRPGVWSPATVLGRRDLGDDDGPVGGDSALVNDGKILLGREGMRRVRRMGEIAISRCELGTAGTAGI